MSGYLSVYFVHVKLCVCIQDTRQYDLFGFPPAARLIYKTDNFGSFFFLWSRATINIDTYIKDNPTTKVSEKRLCNILALPHQAFAASKSTGTELRMAVLVACVRSMALNVDISSPVYQLY